MAKGIKIGGRLPAGDADGLSASASRFVNSPDVAKVAIVILDTKRIEHDQDTGDETAVLRIRRAEVITDAEDGQKLTRLLVREMERRTGKSVLPLEMEDTLLDVFAGIDKETGELRLPLTPGADDTDAEED